MSDSISLVGPEDEIEKWLDQKRLLLIAAPCLLLLFAIASIGPIMNGLKQARANARMQQTRMIGQYLFCYSADHQGIYPDGDSSTEVFQKLLDGGYVSDPAVFYLPLPGKVKPIAGNKLKPENVGFDVTSGPDSSSPVVPLVFMTGYKVTYVPGGAAVPISKPYPRFSEEPYRWIQWLTGQRNFDVGPPGIAMFYKGNNAKFIQFNSAANLDGSIPNFIPADFDSKGKIYRQLTPDGPLP